MQQSRRAYGRLTPGRSLHALLVIGSQSILGSFGEFMLPPTATVSVEADLLPFDDLSEVKADTIDGLLGADS